MEWQEGREREHDSWVEQKCWWVDLACGFMERTTNKKMARARLLEAQAAAAAEREARERQNIDDLAGFMVETAKADGVDEWLSARIEKAREDAEVRRLRHRTAAGKALQAMRFRGETVTGIASQAGITPVKVREYLKLAAVDGPSGSGGERGAVLDEQPVAVPTDVAANDGGQVGAPTAMGAQ